MGATGITINREGWSLWYKRYDQELLLTFGEDQKPLNEGEAQLLIKNYFDDKNNAIPSFILNNNAMMNALIMVLEAHGPEFYQLYHKEQERIFNE